MARGRCSLIDGWNSAAQHRLVVSRKRISFCRSACGHGIAEFAPALMILFAFLIILGDFAMLPVRYVVTRELIEHTVRQLAESESFTEAQNEVEGDSKLREKLIHLGGVTPVNLDLRLVATSLSKPQEKPLMVTDKGQVPKQWLPDGNNCPCNYELELVANVTISPAVLFSMPIKVQGVTEPISCVFTASERWENRTRNPVTKGYFLNE